MYYLRANYCELIQLVQVRVSFFHTFASKPNCYLIIVIATTRLLILMILLEVAYASKGYNNLPMIAAILANLNKVLVGIAAVRV